VTLPDDLPASGAGTSPHTTPAHAERVFLGWDRPLIGLATEQILRRFADADRLDLGDVLVVLPGGRAKRLMLASLVDTAADRGLLLTPPVRATPSEIGAAFVRPPTPPAEPLTRRLAWVEALRRQPPDHLAALSPRAEDAADSLASLLDRASAELASGLVRFDDVPHKAAHALPPEEEPRWRAMASAQRDYERVLDEWGLHDPALAQQHALRGPIDTDQIVSTPPRSILLVGVSELAPAVRALLARFAPELLALVFAPPELQERFDPLGCVRVEAWASATLPLDDDSIIFADAPVDQAERALEAVASLEGSRSAEQITLCAPDRSVVAPLARAFETAGGVALHDAAGTPVARTAPAQLLDAIRRYATHPSATRLLELVRHPDLEPALSAAAGASSWLEKLDDWARRRLPRDLSRATLATLPGPGRRVVGTLSDLLGQLDPVGDHAGDEARPAGAWSEPVLRVLARVYADRARDRRDPADRVVIESCTALAGAARQLAAAGSSDDAAPRITCAEALALTLDAAGATPVADPPRADAIELIGWLEALADPAPELIVTGMNEGLVPASLVADPLVPDGLRRALGITDDRARLARDAYHLAAIVSSRARVTLICGRRGDDNEPRTPTRLLYRCERGTLVERVRRFTDASRARAPSVRVPRGTPPAMESAFASMPIVPVDPVTEMSVTDFRAYIRSPYLYYLERVLRLRTVEDRAFELDAPEFGHLMHEALRALSDSGARDATDASQIESVLLDALAEEARERFGHSPSATVLVQLRLAERRLRAFAPVQAERRRAGWRIIKREWESESSLIVDDEPMRIRGTLDRIERHEETGQLAVLDYKTSDTARTPDEAHRKGRSGDKRWVDLQLPLYRRLLEPLEPEGEVQLGYAVLPKDSSKSAISPAAWSSDELAEADAMAEWVVRRVRDGAFDELEEAKPVGVLGAICGVELLGGQEVAPPSGREEDS